VFRHHRGEIWTELEKHLMAGDQVWNGEEIRVRHGPFEVTLDQHAEVTGRASIVQTRLRAAFHNRDDFRFRLRRQDWLADLAVLLGAQDLKIGDPAFDDAFVVSANDEERARLLLADSALRAEMVDADLDLLEVKDDEGWFGPEFPPEVDELCLCTRERLNDPERLAELYEIFADTLNRLCHLGAAYEEDPQVRL
jgi:hypothetical protein